MSDTFSYQDYVADEAFLKAYNEYQKKYSGTVRESDKKMIALVHDIANGMSDADGDLPRLLDIGCSTGNFLLHLKRMMGEKLRLCGGDLARSSIEACRNTPDLEGVEFDLLNILDLPREHYDIVVANVVLYLFSEEEYRKALKSIYGALRPGGSLVIYDFAHDFPQEIEIMEKTADHPEGLRLCFRSHEAVAAAFKEAGFASWDFQPFELPIDLPRVDNGTDVITYTRKDEHGERMAFRGVLFQPWCHMIARKGT